MKAFIDSNIPMYLIGADHPNKFRAKVLIEKLIAEKAHLITDVEVFQEILHRYTAINRRDAIQPCFDMLSGIIDTKVSIDEKLIEKTKSLVLEYNNISARDALHIAAMKENDCSTIVSFDSGFDCISNIDRIES